MSTRTKVINIGRYRGMDPRAMPNYPLSEAAIYLGIPPSTLRTWVRGRSYPARDGERFFSPLITPPGDSSEGLSQLNLVEAYVLDSIRNSYKLPLYKVRSALEYAADKLGIEHPLASEAFKTDGIDLFIDKAEETINISMKGKVGQMALRGFFAPYLERISYDDKGLPVRLFLLTRHERSAMAPRTVEIRPFIASGRPVLAGTRIMIEMIGQRFEAGDSIEEMAGDYGLEREQIEEGIRSWSVLKSRALRKAA